MEGESIEFNDETLSEKALGERVEKFAEITMSDDITTDKFGNIYLTDMGHAAIHRIYPKGNLRTLFKDSQKLRWPDGFSWEHSLFFVTVHKVMAKQPNNPVRVNTPVCFVKTLQKSQKIGNAPVLVLGLAGCFT